MLTLTLTLTWSMRASILPKTPVDLPSSSADQSTVLPVKVTSVLLR